MTPEEIKNEIKKSGLKQKDVAALLYITVRSLQKILTGENNMSAPVAKLFELYIIKGYRDK